MKVKFRKSDILVEFEHHLRTVEKIGHNTSMKLQKTDYSLFKASIGLDSAAREDWYAIVRNASRRAINPAQP